MIRRIWKHRGAFALNLLALTLGISCFLFTLLYVVYERSFDRWHVKRDRICRMATDINSGGTNSRAAVSLGILCGQLPGEFPEIERMVRFMPFDGHTGFRWKPQEPLITLKKVYYTDENAFGTFTYPLLEGDAHTALSAPNCVVVTEALKRRIFGKGEAMGQTLMANGKPLTVTGVLADLPGNTDLSFEALISLTTLKTEDANDWGFVYILFKSAAAMQAWQPKMDTLTKKYINPQFDPDGITRLRFVVQPFSDLHFSELRERDNPKGNALYVDIFLVTGVLVLLIACINSINLSIVQSFSRVMDVTIRKIYGASGMRLILQHTGESLFTGVVATLLSFLLVWLLLPAFAVLVNRSMALTNIFNEKVIAAAAGALLLLGLGGSVYTGVYLHRVQLADSLRGKNGRVSGLRILPRIMLGFQFFITIGMLVVATSVFRQVRYLRDTPPGFNANNVLVVNLPQEDSAARGNEYLRNSLAHDPDVVETAGCDEAALPGKGVDIDVYRYKENGVHVKKTIYHIGVDAHYLSVMEIPVIQGEGFREVPDSAGRYNVLVTAGFARKMGWKQPIGEIIYHENEKRRVIGVVPDFHYYSLHQAMTPLVIFQAGNPELLLLRVTPAKTAAVLKKLETEWRTVFPESPLVYSFLDEHLTQQYRDDYNLLSLLMTLTVLMIAISCTGLIAYIHFLLRMARMTIAIRRVIGASFGDIYGLYARQFVWLLGIAFVAAGPPAWWLANRWLNQFAYHISPRAADLVITLLVMGLLVGMILLRSALRSVRMNPGRVIREN